MTSRTLSILLGALALAGCDPTGNTTITADAASVRLANFVVDAPALSMSAAGVTTHSSVGFGQVSLYKQVGTDKKEFTLSRTSDSFVLGSDSVNMVLGRHYTLYALGTVGGFVPRFALDDTVLALTGNVKIRFLHGAAAYSGQGIDLYASLTTDSLVDITPIVPALAYGSVSTYVTTDTALRRIRLALNGTTTAIFDTTIAAGITNRSVVTIVASDKSGGGTPVRVQVVVDKAP